MNDFTYPPLSYILDLIESEGRVDDFNRYAEESSAPVLVSVYRFYRHEMDIPF